jgi:hypothetical protein
MLIGEAGHKINYTYNIQDTGWNLAILEFEIN